MIAAQDVESIKAQIANVKFSPYVQDWLNQYKAAGGKRGDYLWRWCYINVKLVTLPCVPSDMVDHLADTKMLHLVFLCLIDDIVDEMQDEEMFAAAMEITQGRYPRWSNMGVEKLAYMQALENSWFALWERMATYSRFAEFEQDLRFDYAQVIQGLWHSLLVNKRPTRTNVVEAEAYQPHNMAMVYMAMLDLCASPSFDSTELGFAREIFTHAQVLGRVGNTLATWEREVKSSDYASAYFAWAVRLDVIKSTDLTQQSPEWLQEKLQSPSITAALEHVRTKHGAEIFSLLNRVKSIDLMAYYDACEALVATHKLGRGLM